MARLFISRCIAAAATTALLASSAHAQINMTSFKNFKHYPTSGQWSQELVGYRDNKPLGPPVTSTTCAGPMDMKDSPIMEMAKQAAASCTIRKLADQERLIEFENSCKVGSGVQTIHVQMRAIDDRTIATETRSTLPGLPETVLKSKATYLGPCPAGAAAAQQKASAEDCAEIAQMRRDLNAGAANPAQCAQVPARYRAQCEQQMAGSAKAVEALEAKCR